MSKRRYSKYARRKAYNPTIAKPQLIYMHKQIAGITSDYMMNFRDGNSLNMQRANMKITNLRHEPVKWMGSNGKSSFKGVVWDKYYGLWRAEIKGLVIGYYIAELVAAEEYNRKAVEFYGENTDINNTDLEIL